MIRHLLSLMDTLLIVLILVASFMVFAWSAKWVFHVVDVLLASFC